MECTNAKQEVLEQECTAVIFERGALGLEFVQQADRVVVSTVQPGSVAAKLPFPRVELIFLPRMPAYVIDEMVVYNWRASTLRGSSSLDFVAWEALPRFVL